LSPIVSYYCKVWLPRKLKIIQGQFEKWKMEKLNISDEMGKKYFVIYADRDYE